MERVVRWLVGEVEPVDKDRNRSTNEQDGQNASWTEQPDSLGEEECGGRTVRERSGLVVLESEGRGPETTVHEKAPNSGESEIIVAKGSDCGDKDSGGVVGLPAKEYTSKSLRRGFVTIGIAMGVKPADLNARGGWCNTCRILEGHYQ